MSRRRIRDSQELALVFEYIRAHPKLAVLEIAGALNLPLLLVRQIIVALLRKQLVAAGGVRAVVRADGVTVKYETWVITDVQAKVSGKSRINDSDLGLELQHLLIGVNPRRRRIPEQDESC